MRLDAVRQILWPSRNLSDSDVAGRYGLCLCIALGAYEFYVSAYYGQYTLATVTFSMYAVGGCGIRERSTLAAVLLALWCLFGQIGNIMLGLRLTPVGSTGTVLSLLLIRATWVGARTPQERTFEEMLAAGQPTLLNTLLDRVPRAIWKTARTPALLFGGLMVAATMYGTLIAIAGDRGTVQSLEPLPSAKSPASR